MATATPNTCKSCNNPISPKAYDCPSCGHPQRKPRRGFFGFIFKWLFIAFNLFMIAWLFLSLGAVGEVADQAQSDAEMVGTAIGATIGMTALAMVWVFGDIILGILVLFTRPRK